MCCLVPKDLWAKRYSWFRWYIETRRKRISLVFKHWLIRELGYSTLRS